MRRRVYLGTVCSTLLAVSGCSSSSSPVDSPIPSENITAYGSLTATGKEQFQTILEQGSIERPINRIPLKLQEAGYIRYDGDVYRISKTDTDRNTAVYILHVDSVEESTVDESELLSYSNLSQEAKEAFDQAIEKGTDDVRIEALPNELREHSVVKYEGTYYEFLVSVADIRVWKISATKVSD